VHEPVLLPLFEFNHTPALPPFHGLKNNRGIDKSFPQRKGEKKFQMPSEPAKPSFFIQKKLILRFYPDLYV